MSINGTANGTHTQEHEASFLRVKDLQRELNVSQQIAYRLVRSGAIPSIRLGNTYRIRRSDLENLTASSDLENA